MVQERPQIAQSLCGVGRLLMAPIAVADGMMQCAERRLHKDDFLFIYGPFEDHGECTTEANQAIDPMIHSAGVFEWGLKDIADLEKAANVVPYC